ncbi:MAG TPA: membrane protein insertase YidC [Candidatus Sulfotelmatobacter sp.]
MADYQNPQQEPGSEKRLLLVFLLTFVVLMIFEPMLKKYFPQPPAAPAQKQAAPAQGAPAPAPAKTETAGSVVAKPGKKAPAPEVVVNKQAATEAETVIENGLYKITFTNRGAQVKSWILKKFNNDAQNGPLDLVNDAAGQKYGYPLSLWTYDAALNGKLNSALYVASNTGSVAAPSDITFEYSDQDVIARKTFHFDHSYVVGVEVSVAYKGEQIFAAPAWPAGFGDQVIPSSYSAARIEYHNDASTEHTALVFPSYVSRLSIKSISSGKTVEGPFEWAGTSDQYFAALFLPTDPAGAAMVTLRNAMEVPKQPGSKETTKVEPLGAAVGDLRGTTNERLYVGPKELSVLETVPVLTIRNDRQDLRGIVDFGWWGLLARPLFLWLKWTYRYMWPNWGWAIVIQTFIITAALLPLRITQMKSMLKMQRVAPQIKSIQEKYKKYSLRDPRKAAMNEEISGLYKKEGVNPAGGCLPMLIQLPFLYAYYRMLAVAIDLRHAHWLWIKDLSARDPYFLLPILMVISMFAMQRMTPQAGMDPSQQKMMNWMMPLFMGFIFFNLQAGLNLYYAETNLISIAQQAVMNRTKLGKEMREMMAKRARKKDK